MSVLSSAKELYQAYRVYHTRGIMSKSVYNEQIENSTPVNPLIEFTYIENMSSEDIERNFEDIKKVGVGLSGFGISIEDIAYLKESQECKISSFTTKKCKIGYTSDNTYYKVFEKNQKIILIDTDEPVTESTDISSFPKNEEYITGQAYMRIRKFDKPLEPKWKRAEKQQRYENVKANRTIFWKLVTVVTELAGPFIIQSLFFNNTALALVLYLLAAINFLPMMTLFGIGVLLPWMAAKALSGLKGLGGFVIRILGMVLLLVLSIVIVHFPSVIALWAAESSGSVMVIIITSVVISAIAGLITKAVISK